MADRAVRAQEFLRESEALDGAPGNRAGHLAALLDSQEKATGHAALEESDLMRWHQQVSGQLPAAAPAELDTLVQQLNQQLAAIRGPEQIVEVACLIGDGLHDFCNMRPFGEGAGRVGRLLANYLATRCGVPILVFRESEHAELARGLEDRGVMRCYVASKLREAVYDFEGNLTLRTAAYDSTDRYRTEDGNSLLIEWHQLLDACDQWKKEGAQ